MTITGVGMVPSVLADRVDPGSIQPFAPIPGSFRFSVPGPSCVEVWRQLRPHVDQTGLWPVLIGRAPEARESVEEALAIHPLGVEALLSGVPEDPFERLRRDKKKHQDMLRAWAAKRDVPASVRVLMASAPPPYAPPDRSDPGPWPDDASPHDDFVMPGERPVEGLFLPTPHGADVPAWLRFGHFNACPHPQVHVALFRRWAERYGAEPVAITRDTIEMVVSRPPTSRAEALELAWDQFEYCEDIVTQGVQTVANLAAALLGGRAWYFWWD